MNEAFFELPQEKQQRIMNAGFEVFSQNEYKRASTDEIAARGSISKGLLFYYFHNKKTLYLYLFEKAMELMTECVVTQQYKSITDFFELCEYAALQKQKMLEKSPYLLDFLTRAFYSQREDVSAELNERLTKLMMSMYTDFMGNVDRSKFKPGVDPEEILRMLSWLGDGYLHENQRLGRKMDVEESMRQYRQWTAIIREATYREEYKP